MFSLLFLVLGAPAPDRVDVEDHRAKLQLWTDGKGHYIAGESALEHVYYGDGKVFFQSSPYAWGTSNGVTEVTMRDQRYDGQSQTELKTSSDGTLTVACGKRVTKLAPVPAEQTKSTLAKAEFNRTPHPFKAYALSRDDKGTYYYVDNGRFPDNERTFRVFIGQRGNMKEQKLSNIVHDSAGDIFATSSGDLRLVVGRSSEWVRAENHVKLIDIPVEDNVPMIYNELGVYKKLRLGTPCDDL